MITYASLNHLWPNPVWRDIVISQSVTVKVTVTEFWFIQSNMTISIICSELLIFLETNLIWQCMFISWSVLWKGCLAVFKVKVTVMVLNFSECLPGQYLWSVKLSMVMHHHQPEYHSEISFCYVQESNWPLSWLYSCISGVFCNTRDTDLWRNITHNSCRPVNLCLIYLCTQEMSSFHFQIIT